MCDLETEAYLTVRTTRRNPERFGSKSVSNEKQRNLRGARGNISRSLEAESRLQGLCNMQRHQTQRKNAKASGAEPEKHCMKCVGAWINTLSFYMYIYGEESKKREREGRNARRNCGWDGAAKSRSKPPAVWAPPPGDTARRGENARAGKRSRQDERRQVVSSSYSSVSNQLVSASALEACSVAAASSRI